MTMKNKIQQLIPWMYPWKIGYFPRMIFDRPRNKFYWELLKQCKDKTCVDVGFGTGILTLIALHHGAKHVIAYEQDPSAFQLGKYIIERLGFHDKVTFVNEKYNTTNHQDRHVDLIFHEIMGRNIWREGIRDTFRGETTKVVPSIMSCNIRLFDGTNSLPPAHKRNLELMGTVQLSTGVEWLDNTFTKVLRDLWKENDTITYDDIGYRSGEIIGHWEMDINSHVPDIIEVDIKADDGIVFTDYFADGFLLSSADSWPYDKSIRVNKSFTKFYQNTKDGNWWLE
jgi:hypothetical protein